MKRWHCSLKMIFRWFLGLSKFGIGLHEAYLQCFGLCHYFLFDHYTLIATCEIMLGENKLMSNKHEEVTKKKRLDNFTYILCSQQGR